MFGFCRQAAVAILLAALAVSGARAQEDLAPVVGPELSKELLADVERQASQGPPDTSDPQDLCVHFHKRGIADFRLGRYDQSVNDLKQALSLNQPNRPAPNNWCNRWRIQCDLSGALAALGDHFAQLEHLRAVGVEARRTHTRHYFFSQLFMINPYVEMGMLREADEAFRRASEVLPEVKTRQDWATEQHSVMDYYGRYSAWLQELRGNYVGAERLRRASLADAKQYLELTLSKLGEDSQLVRIARGAVTGTTRHLANTLSAQGKMGEAEYFANEALKQTIAYSSFSTVATSSALSTLGMIKLQQGKVADAARYVELGSQALEQSSVEPYSTVLAQRRAQLGLIYCIQGRLSDALRVFAARDQGLRSNPKQFTKFGSRQIDWAMALLKTGQSVEAADMLRRVLNFNLKKPFANPVYVAQLRGYLAVALAEQGDDSQALALFKMALPTLISGIHDDSDAENSGFIRVYRTRLILEGYLELLGRLRASGQDTAGLDVVTEAFKIADVARNSSVQRAVTASAARATIADAQLAQLARREQDASNQIQSLSKLLVHLASAPEGQRLQKVVDDMQGDIESLTAKRVALRKEIVEKFPDYANLIDPQPATPADIQQVLWPDEAVVAIYSGDRQCYVWTITKSEVGFRIAPVPRAQIAQDVASIRHGLDLSDGRVRDFDFAKAYRLYATLLAPDSAKWAAAKAITVIPHADLGQLPFAVLLTAPVAPIRAKTAPAYGNMPWLIRKVAIAQQASASGFLALRRNTPVTAEQKPFIGFGDPLFAAGAAAGAERGGHFRSLRLASAKDQTLRLVEQGRRSAMPVGEAAAVSSQPLTVAFSMLPALPDTATELTDIAQTTGADKKSDLFLGARATELNVKASDLSRYRIVAFATHGLVPGDIVGLDQPALAMANPALTDDRDNDGFLTLEDVLGLKLNAEWVVLSACNTASSDGNASEAVSGLGRAFFYAGARSLLVSNWAVETVSARLLTTGLFRQQAGHPTMPRAEALRQSMLAVMNDDKNQFGHPAFWAPFSLVGDGLGH